MAGDSFPYANSDSFAQPQQAFYPLKIPVSHWQLRHYISHPEKDVLYYASGQDIYYLNTATRKRKHIATLPFEARCTASGHGYVCVGGEDEGNFAIVKLEGRTADVDAPLPLDYWHTHRSTPHAAGVRVARIGEEIVNSISIHRIQDEEAHLYDVVAVLTNNDKTVRVYSLSQGIETCTLDLPFPMNHATISPDGRSLAAVGDVNKVFFYTRRLLRDPPQIPKPHNRLTMCSVGWHMSAHVQLHIPEATAHAGYFTTAWSSSGHMLAVGSEAGYITVFDMLLAEKLAPYDMDAAIVACVPSSRPNIQAHMHPGAVRSILFAPEPWDLLIWAEDQGRICIGDLRTGLRTKQVIPLDPKSETLTRVHVDDDMIDDEALGSRRLLQLEEELLQRTTTPLGTHPADAQSRLRARRHHRAGSRPSGGEAVSFDDDPQGLTATEQQILESLRTSRQREEARTQGGAPRSINYTSSELFPSQRPGRQEDASEDNVGDLGAYLDYQGFPELSRSIQRGPPVAGPQAASQDETLSASRDGVQHWSRQAMRFRDRQAAQHESREAVQSRSDTDRWQPRRRASVVLSPPTMAPNQRHIPPYARRAEGNPLLSPPQDTETPVDLWRRASSTMALSQGPLFESAAEEYERDRESLQRLGQQREQLRQLQSRLEASSGSANTGSTRTRDLADSRYELLRDATNTARGLQDSYEILRRRGTRLLNTQSTATGREIGVRTAGLAIDRDGTTVWAATEEGVFEIKLALKARMRWPAFEPR